MENPYSKQRIEQELEKQSSRYHFIGAWVAIFFDPVFGITDYFNIQNGWIPILVVRFSVSIITLITLFLWRKYRFPSYILVFVPFLLISLQNAFTYDFIVESNYLGHTLNYIALWIGAGMFIVWSWRYSAFMLAVSLVATWYFIQQNPALSGRYDLAMVEGGLLLIVVAIFMMALIQTRYQLTIKTIKAQLALEKSNEALQIQKELTERKNKSIMDSIRYAERIQNATLPEVGRMQQYIPQLFVLFKPRDVVSGDFYWYCHRDGKTLIAAVDCTGHGVPGAFMSMKGDALLNQIVVVERVSEPHLVLQAMHEGIRSGLKQETTKNYDGMDASILLVDQKAKTITFAGAKNPLIYIQDKILHTINGDKVAIGGHQKESKRAFTPHKITIDRPTSCYIFSDGYQDQFGGPDRKKLGKKMLRKLLLECHQAPCEQQKEFLDQNIQSWMKEGEEHQIDDILMIGMKLGHQ